MEEPVGSRAGTTPTTTPIACPFDFSRCRGNLTIYVYDHEPLVDLRDYMFYVFKTILTRSRLNAMIVSDPGDACLFIFAYTHPFDAAAQDKYRLAEGGCRGHGCLPYWNGGENHIVWNVWDANLAPAASVGKAMLFSSSGAVRRDFRPSCDVSLALWPKRVFPDLGAIPVGKPRKYLLTFQGKLDQGDRQRIMGIFARMEGAKKHGIVMNGGRYRDLMNTTFALIPPGHQPGTHRLVEAMSAGAIPVFYGLRDYVKPYHRLIDWRSCSLELNETVHTDGERVLATLNAVSPARRRAMQRCVREAYAAFLGPDTIGDGLLLSFLQLLHLQRGREGLDSRYYCESGFPVKDKAPARDYKHNWTSFFFCANSSPCTVEVPFKVPCFECRRQEFKGKRVCDSCGIT